MRSKSSRRHAWEGKRQAGPGSWILWECSHCHARWRLPAGQHPKEGECGRVLVSRRGAISNGRDEEYRRFVREKGCCLERHELHECSGRIDFHHVQSRGAGWSDWLPDGSGNGIGACRIGLHRLFSEVNWGKKRLEEMFHVSFAQLAREGGERYHRHRDRIGSEVHS